MATSKLYKVTNRGHVHLVAAKTQGEAVRYVVDSFVSVELLTALQTAELMAAGHKVMVIDEPPDLKVVA